MYIPDKDTLKPAISFYVILGVLIVLANAFLVHALRKLQKLNSVSHRFILILSVSDIITGVLFGSVIPIYTSIEDDKVSSLVYMYSSPVVYFFGRFSFFMIITIATDRYIHMRFLTKYTAIMTNARGVKVIIGVILITIFLNGILACGEVFGFAVQVTIFYGSVNAVFLTVLFIQYARAYKALRHNVKGLFQERGSASSVKVNIINVQRAPSRQFAKAVLLILGSAAICYAPAIVYLTIANAYPSLLSVPVYLGLQSLLVSNSLFNAIIFIALNNDIKRYMIQCVNYCYQRQSQNLPSSEARTEENL